MIKEFGTYMSSEVASLTLGTNLFIGRRPQGAPNVSVVIEEPTPDNVLSCTQDDYVVKTFRIECRGDVDDYFSARNVAIAILSAMQNSMQVTLPVVGTGPTYVCNIRITRPGSLGPDDRNRSRVVLYAHVTTEEV